MDFANGGLEEFVNGLDSDMTSEGILTTFFSEFSEEGIGIKNRAVMLLAKRLTYYGKPDLRLLLKQSTMESSCKSQYMIAKELIEKYKVISLEESKQLMVYDGNHYTFNTKCIDNFISSKAELLDEDQGKMFGEVRTWVNANLQFPMRNLCFEAQYIPFKNGFYDVARDVVIDKIEDHEDWMFFYSLPHEYDSHPRGLNWTANDNPQCNMFKKATIQWIDAKVYEFNPNTKKNDIRVPGYRKGGRKILLNDIFEMIGLCMSLEVGFKKAFINYGKKDSGKTQFANIIGYIIGQDNMSFQELYILTERFGSTAIQFKLLNLCGDMTNTAINKTGMFTLYTGGDKEIPSELKGGKKFNFPPTCKFWFNINLFPYVKDFNNDAFFERFILILFPNVFTNTQEEFKINYYEEITRNKSEIQGIIYESLMGLQRLYKRKGFRKEIEENTKHIWNYHSNPYYRFIEDFCELDKTGRIEVHEFFDRFSDEIGAGHTMFQLNRGLEKLGVRKREVKVAMNNNPKKRISKYYYFGVKWVDKYTSEEISDPGLSSFTSKPQGPLDKIMKKTKLTEEEATKLYGDIPDEYK